MEYTERGLFNKVSDPLKVRHTLDCIAADTNYLNKIYLFVYNTGIKIMICQLQNAKSNFPKLCKVHAPQKIKYKYGIFIFTFSRNLLITIWTKLTYLYIIQESKSWYANYKMPKSNFPEFCKVHAPPKAKCKSVIFIYTFSKNLCFNS